MKYKSPKYINIMDPKQLHAMSCNNYMVRRYIKREKIDLSEIKPVYTAKPSKYKRIKNWFVSVLIKMKLKKTNEI